MLSIYTNKWNRTGLGSMVPGVVVPITVSEKQKQEKQYNVM